MAAKSYRVFFLILLTLFIVFSAFAQTPDTQTVQSADGVILIRNDKVQRFSFFVAGKNSSVRQAEDGGIAISTDEGGLYAYFVKTTEFLDAKKPFDRSEILEAHRDRDLETEEKAQQTKLDARNGADFIAIKDVANPLFPEKVVPSLFWHYSPPGSDAVVLYQTVLLGETVLMLRTVFPKSIKIEEPRGFLRKVLQSVALLPQPPKKISVAPKKQPAKPGRKQN